MCIVCYQGDSVADSLDLISNKAVSFESWCHILLRGIVLGFCEVAVHFHT